MTPPLALKRLDAKAATFDAELARLLHWDVSEDDGVNRIVRDILDDVRRRGDAAVLEASVRLDRVKARSLADLEVSRAQLDAALAGLPAAEREALEQAAERVRAYHERQKGVSWQYRDDDGNLLGQQVTALDRVGVYVPGGQASYPSSVLMTVVPARVAGVTEIIMTAPTPDDAVNPLVLAAARLAGVDRVVRIGGAQAIAALAYGTESIPKVDKIVGPGGAFVAAAKRMVFGPVGIDMIAGPSEILVIADASSKPEWLALDLFSQAEHDEAAQAILVSADGELLEAVHEAMLELLPKQPRADVIRASLEARGALIKVPDLAAAVSLANRIAPEHLELAVADPERLLPQVRHAGAIFLGHHSPEALGDYVAGPSHVLPTYGTARFSSPLGVYDFEKRSSLIGCSAPGAERLARTASILARSEGLAAHADSAEARISGFDGNRAR